MGYRITSTESWFVKSKNEAYLATWREEDKQLNVYRGPVNRDVDKPIASYGRKIVPTRRDIIKSTLRAIRKHDLSL